MELISINTSKQKCIEYQGKEISTGIFKEPEAGKVFIRKGNLVGDEQADLLNHGGSHKAVYAFSYDHYAYWREILNNNKLKYGAFGENLTISDFDEASLFIGDQFSIGDCVLEVSQPRVPCFKLGIALNNTKAPKLFTKSFNTGVYFRVIKEGIVSHGNRVNKINEVSNSVSVRSLFRAYFDKNYDNANKVITNALQLDTLAPEWKEKLAGKIA
ncbi:MAG: MOSC domain-containing protein [Sedimenticola sp.]